MDSAQMQRLCRRYSEVGSCERNRLKAKIAEYAAAKARRLDRIARRHDCRYQAGFFPEKAREYAFDSWYGGEIHIVLPSVPDADVGVPFEAFDPGYEKEYGRRFEERHGGD